MRSNRSDLNVTHEPTPALNQAANHHKTRAPNGHVSWREWGSGPVLLLIHGGTGSWRHWAANIERLAQTHHVYTPDTPGLGESDRPADHATAHEIAASMVAGLDMLIGPDTKFDVCGFSYGAMIAGIIAAQQGTRVRSLTVIGPGALGLPRHSVKLEKVRSKQGQERVEANRINLGIFMLARPERIDDLAVDIQDYNTIHARFKSKDFAHTPILAEALAAATAPVHAIWGDKDVTAVPDIPTRIAIIRSVRPDARFTIIPGAGHWTAWDAPDALETALRTSFTP